ncbi:MAG: aldolase [Planctomycetes bacterium]|nr:aldolase [Planctomycetota bacterium]
MRTTPLESLGPGRVPLGIWQLLPSPAVSRYLAQMGWDWVILDLQHGSMSLETAYECVHAIRAAGSVPLLRVKIGDPSEVQRALDMGARGVVVPMVSSPEEARAMARAAKYPPLGARSIGSDAALHYGADYPERANAGTLLLTQIEHIDAVRQVEAILAVEGVDGTFVGPTDLALSMGLGRKGFEGHPAHAEAMARTLKACKSARKLACCNTYSPDDFEAKLAAGYDAISLRSEVDLFVDAGQALLAELRGRLARLRKAP